MNIRLWVWGALAVTCGCVVGCAGGVPPDEGKARLEGSLRAGKRHYTEESGDRKLPESGTAKWPYPPKDDDFESTPAGLAAAAAKYFPPAAHDYFAEMDAFGTTAKPGAAAPRLSKEAIKGRNAWVLWAGGNEAFWDWLARHGYGSIDLLKLIDSRERGTRFKTRGLLTEPGTRPPTDDDTAKSFGVRYDRPDPAAHAEYKFDGEKGRPNPSVYGYPTGVVGLRLFPNPEFDEAARSRWRADLYYDEGAAGREYASRPDTIRPFRVGLSCGFCHVAPHPLKPPADPEFPEWANLSNNIGNQFLRPRAVFGNVLRPDNLLYHVLDAQQPGTIDTSLIASDNILNYNTIIPIYGLRGRVERAGLNPPEELSPRTVAYFRDFVAPHYPDQQQRTTPRQTLPRVLIDGSDSVGLENALARVYLNIGTHHQQWVRVHNPLLGFRKQEPFRLRDIAENSVYWHATQLRVAPLRQFFLESTDPMRLRDADTAPADGKPGIPKAALAAALGKADGVLGPDDGLPWSKEYAVGRQAFARGCIACHSSIQPGDLPELEAVLALPESPAERRLRPEDRARLTRGDGQLPPAYQRWAQAAVHQRLFWEHKGKDEQGAEVVVANFLSTDARVPVTTVRTNASRAVATNALTGHLWEDVSSDTYRNLDGVGAISYRDPFAAADKSFIPHGGGQGYYRVPTLISVWASAPLFHNNMLGTFTNNPSVAGRVAAFDDAATRLLFPETRSRPSARHAWDNTVEPGPPKTVFDGWYPGKLRQDADAAREPAAVALAAGQLEADGGHVWRTSADSWLAFEGHDVPVLIAGVTGFSPFWVRLLPWLPALAFVGLGVLLLLGWRGVRLGGRLEARFPVLGYTFGPIRYLLAVGGTVAAGVAGYLVLSYWYLLVLVDIVISIPFLKFTAVVAPVLFLGGVALLFWLPRLSEAGRRRVGNVVGAACLLTAALLAATLGRFASGHGEGIRFGPFPEGIPINAVAGLNPDAEPARLNAAIVALGDFALEWHRAKEKGGPLPGKERFEGVVGPKLMGANKCPDFVTDRGHDFEFMRHLTADEKKALILLLKTF